MKRLAIYVAIFVALSVSAAESQDASVAKAVEKATGWTVEELTNSLQLIHKVYEREVKTSAGRVRWYGPVTKVMYDTNRLEKVTVYENGRRHIEKFDKLTSLPLSDRLSAADRAALMEKRRAEAARRREEKRLSRIAELQTNLAENVESVMKAKRWPEDLARLYLQHELNTLIGTNIVTVTVEAGK